MPPPYALPHHFSNSSRASPRGFVTTAIYSPLKFWRENAPWHCSSCGKLTMRGPSHPRAARAMQVSCCASHASYSPKSKRTMSLKIGLSHDRCSARWPRDCPTHTPPTGPSASSNHPHQTHKAGGWSSPHAGVRTLPLCCLLLVLPPRPPCLLLPPRCSPFASPSAHQRQYPALTLQHPSRFRPHPRQYPLAHGAAPGLLPQGMHAAPDHALLLTPHPPWQFHHQLR